MEFVILGLWGCVVIVVCSRLQCGFIREDNDCWVSKNARLGKYQKRQCVGMNRKWEETELESPSQVN